MFVEEDGCERGGAETDIYNRLAYCLDLFPKFTARLATKYPI
jgi:hypothetical protein